MSLLHRVWIVQREKIVVVESIGVAISALVYPPDVKMSCGKSLD